MAAVLLASVVGVWAAMGGAATGGGERLRHAVEVVARRRRGAGVQGASSGSPRPRRLGPSGAAGPRRAGGRRGVRPLGRAAATLPAGRPSGGAHVGDELYLLDPRTGTERLVPIQTSVLVGAPAPDGPAVLAIDREGTFWRWDAASAPGPLQVVEEMEAVARRR